ncbi:hypothetical protein EIP91_000227 [Steccherinum ochraceum]|nr:hypothetical protein EIP91_000227 [Steccherinum ochraceum]
MSVVNPASASSDPWDYSPPTQPSVPISHKKVPAAVPDDWDADEDEEDEPERLWENANKKAPMPVVITSTGTSSSVISPPPAAFQPSLRILKRPSASSSSAASSSNGSDAQQKTYAEREAQYQAARERIFGSGTTTPTQGVSTSDRNKRSSARYPGSPPGSASPPPSTVIRNPRGPEDTTRTRGPDSGSGRGFNNRRGAVKKGSTERGADLRTSTPPG